MILYARNFEEDVSTLTNYDPFGDGSGIALYRFENNAIDEGGTYNGAATGVTYGAGVYGNCAIFNGGLSNINIGLGSTSFLAVSALINVSQTGILAYMLGSQDTNQSKSSIRLGTDGVDLWINNKNTAKTMTVSQGWHHLVGSYNGSVTEVYLDKVLLTGVTNSTLSSIGTTLSFGRYKSGYTSTSQKLDQVRFFNRPLTSSEVTKLYMEVL